MFGIITILLPLFIGCILSTDAVIPNFYWRDYVAGDIPCDAFEAVPGRYIGQVNMGLLILVADIYPHLHLAFAEQEGRQTITKNIQIFCTPVPNRFYWEFVNFDKPNDQMFTNAVKGGYQTDISQNLFIGKIIVDEKWSIGKVIPVEDKASNGLYLWGKDAKSVTYREFYILKYNFSAANDDSCMR